MIRVQVGQRQFAWLLTTLLTAGGLLVLPRELVRISGRDAWLTILPPALAVLVTCHIFFRLSSLYPGKNIFEISNLAMGRIAGTLFNVILLLHFWLLLQRDMSIMSKFINIVLLTRTPEANIIIVMVGVLVYFGKLGIEDKVRVNEMLFPIFIFVILVLPLLLAGEIEIKRLEPFMVTGIRDWIASSVVNYGWLGNTIVMGAFLHTITQAQVIRVSLRNGLLTSAALLSLVSLTLILVMGVHLSQVMIFPIYTLTQQISLTDFLDRVELFVFAVWLPITMMKVIFIYGAFLIGVGSIFKSRKHAIYNAPFGMLLIITCVGSLTTITETFNFSLYAAIVNTMITQGLLLFLFFIAWGRHGRRLPKPKDLLRNSIWRTNALLLAAIITQVVGFLWALKYASVGFVCSILFAVLLIAIVVSSRNEIHHAKKLQS
jgi:spore germination protein KB